MKRRDLIIGVPITLLAASGRAFSQQSRKLPRIGVLVSASPPHPFADAFWRGLRPLGYSDGQNIDVEFHYTGGRSERAEELADEIVHRGVDVIVAHFTPAVRAALGATRRSTQAPPLPISPRESQESTAALAPARDVDHAVHGLAHEHVALLELNKSNRGSPWTAISRFNRRSRVLMVGRPSAPSMDSSTRLSLPLRRRSVGSLSCCRRRRHWSVSHVWLTPRRRAMAGHVSGSCHRATSCASSGWFTNMSRPPD